jgi:hypothetical protein
VGLSRCPAGSKSETGTNSNKQEAKRTASLKEFAQKERQSIMKTQQIRSRAVTNRGLAGLMVGLLTLTGVNLWAEHYDRQDQTLVTGVQRLDPRYPDGQHFVREQCIGVSTVLGLYRESATITRSVVTSAPGVKTAVYTGQSMYTCANGDQLFMSLKGTCIMSGTAGTRLWADVICCTVTVTGGTGKFKNVWGSGQRTCVVKGDGQFSSMTEVTISFPGEK